MAARRRTDRCREGPAARVRSGPQPLRNHRAIRAAGPRRPRLAREERSSVLEARRPGETCEGLGSVRLRVAAGRGFSRIAKGLNAEGIPSPVAGRGWATSGVRKVLFRELYGGRAIYGRTL